MVVVALLLILVALVFGVGVLLTAGDDPAVLRFFEVISVSGTSAGVFAAGAITTLVLLAGIRLLQLGLRRTRRKRAEVKSLRAQAGRSPARSGSPADPSASGTSARRTRLDDPDSA